MEFLPSWPPAFTTQMAAGLLLLAGVLGGFVAHHFKWLPSVTGFMLVGLAIGPSGLGLITADALGLARAVVDVSLGLILYRLGLSLDLRAMRTDWSLFYTAALESVATFGAVFLVLSALDVPPLIAALVSAIVVSSSPAVLLHVAHEVGAEGPVTQRSEQLVAFNNMLSFFAFSALLPAGHLAREEDWDVAVLQPLYQFLGSVLLGIVVGVLLYRLSRLVRRAPQYRLALIIGALLLGLGLADALELSPLFVPLVIGVVVSSLEKGEQISGVEFGEAFELLFIVLFVYAGAKLDPGGIGAVLPLALALAVARIAMKVFAVYLGSRWHGLSPRASVASGLLLVPMAGLAIGLAQTADSLFALQAAQLNALVLTAVAIFETIGPPIAAWAFHLAGETAEDRAEALRTAQSAGGETNSGGT